MKFARFLRVCAVCGQLPFLSTSLLCDACEEHLLKLARLRIRRMGSWTCSTLWTWGADDHCVRELVRKLKGGGDPSLYEAVCEWFLAEWLRAFAAPGFHDVCFVPAPPRTEGYHDHAYELAAAFAAMTGASFSPVLRRLTIKQQKFHNIQERAQLRLAAVETIEGSKTIIFVDDVIVSGATAKSAYEALGRPKGFTAWCMVNRPRLC